MMTYGQINKVVTVPDLGGRPLCIIVFVSNQAESDLAMRETVSGHIALSI